MAEKKPETGLMALREKMKKRKPVKLFPTYDDLMDGEKKEKK